MYAFAIWVTTGCNLRCSYCYEGDDKESNFLDTKSADKIVAFIVKTVKGTTDTIVVDFHGGEPLLNYSIIKYIVSTLKGLEYNFTFGITTNGTICTPELLEFLIQNFTYSLTVSIDGTEEAHNKNRLSKKGEQTYREALKTARLLLKTRPDTRVRMTVVPNNIKQLSKGIIQLINYGFKIIVPALDYFDSSWSYNDIECVRQELHKVRDYIKTNKYFSGLQISMIDERRNRLSKCSGGINAFHIIPNGDIYPCAYSVGYDFERIGNLDSGIELEKVEFFNDIYESKNIECIGCGNYECCASSRCKLLNQKIMGDYNKPIPVICAVENMKSELYSSS